MREGGCSSFQGLDQVAGEGNHCGAGWAWLRKVYGTEQPAAFREAPFFSQQFETATSTERTPLEERDSGDRDKGTRTEPSFSYLS